MSLIAYESGVVDVGVANVRSPLKLEEPFEIQALRCFRRNCERNSKPTEGNECQHQGLVEGKPMILNFVLVDLSMIFILKLTLVVNNLNRFS